MRFSAGDLETGLGGKLFYVGELDSHARGFAVAANIAGAATLAASPDAAALRLALREGAIDFLVNSLDEALRILKNEIRKRQPVAVAVSLPPNAIETEMLERGVLPDLLSPQSGMRARTEAESDFLSQGASEVQESMSTRKLLIWQAPEEYAQNLSGFEAMLAGYLAPDDVLNRRWLRLAPRYLGNSSRRLRSVACDEATITKLVGLLGQPLNR
jgi:urocanate hydratase